VETRTAMKSTAANPELRARVEALPWFHQLDFGDGLLSPGDVKLSRIKRQSSIMFDTMPVAGLSVLDVGCWNGAYSIEACRRGASRVLATDHFVWHQDPRHREAFDLARAQLAPSIEVMDIDVDDLSPETVGTFDVVLFCGVLYHLRHPLAGLERVARLAQKCLVLETYLMRWPFLRPQMRFFPGSELSNDPTNWWGPNRACVEAMLRDVGFRRLTFSRTFWRRGLFHAWRD
jgi:tRNA (mo5U34)-methyltransferase